MVEKQLIFRRLTLLQGREHRFSLKHYVKFNPQNGRNPKKEGKINIFSTDTTSITGSNGEV